MIEIKTEEDFYLIARTFYSNGQGNLEVDMEADLKRIGNLKYQLGKYKNGGGYNIRYMFNHFMIIQNVFGPVTMPILQFKCPERFHECINSLGWATGISKSPEVDSQLCTLIHKEIR